MTIIEILDHNTDAYHTILDVALRECEKAHLIIRPEILNKQYIEEFLDTISDNLIEQQEVYDWPGTTIMGGATATIFFYSINSSFIKKVKEAAPNFYEWVHPFLPEDIGFYSNGEEWLINTAHERYLTIISRDKDILKPIFDHKGVFYESREIF